MNQAITQAELTRQYGFSPRRTKLLSDFSSYLRFLHAHFATFRVLIYGSFLTSKCEPNDIDVVLHVVCRPSDKGFEKLKTLKSDAPARVHVFMLNCSMTYDEAKPLASAEEMVTSFNSLSAHLEKGIVCNHAVEILP